MSLHPSADLRNISRTLLRSLDAEEIAPIVPADDERAKPGSPFLRVTLADDGAPVYAGRLSTYRLTREQRLLTVEVYAKTGTNDGVDDLASRVAGWGAYLSLPLLDCVTDPTGGTTVPGVAVRAVEPPTVRQLAPLEGWARRLVLIPVYWFKRS